MHFTNKENKDFCSLLGFVYVTKGLFKISPQLVVLVVEKNGDHQGLWPNCIAFSHVFKNHFSTKKIAGWGIHRNFLMEFHLWNLLKDREKER